MSRIDILPNVGDFRLLDRRCVLTLRRLRECERYTKGLFCWIGYQKKSIEFDRGDRLMGHSSWNFLKLLNLAGPRDNLFLYRPFAHRHGMRSALFNLQFYLCHLFSDKDRGLW